MDSNNTNNNLQFLQTPNPYNTPIHTLINNPTDQNAQHALLMDLPKRDLDASVEGSGGNSSGRVSVKDIRRSAACLLCRNRKRKCDGNDPCGYCVSKNMVCQYTQQKKRGPQKKSSSPSPTGGGDQLAVQAPPSSYETNILDRIEAQNFGSLYLKYVNLIIPMTSTDKMMNPTTNAHKVQSYSAIAYSARICGDHAKSKQYISQARLLAGSIYDSMDADSIAALLMMSNYWQLTLDIPLSIHYSKLAYSLCRLLPPDSLEYRIQMVCSVGNILCDENTNNKKKSKQLLNVSKAILDAAPSHRYTPLMSSFMSLCAIIIRVFNYNPMFMTSIDSTTKFFTTFSHINLSEEDRVEILKEVNNVNIATTLLGVQPTGLEEHLRVITTIFTPMYMAVVEWRSGHTTEALSHAISCLQGLQVLQDKEIFGYACGVADFPHVVMIGSLCQFLYEQEHYLIAAQLCDKIRIVCKLLSPELDFVMKYTDEFMEKLPPSVAANFQTPSSPPRVAFMNAMHAITSDETEEAYNPTPIPNNHNPNPQVGTYNSNLRPKAPLVYDLDVHDMNSTISNTTATNINTSILTGINPNNPQPIPAYNAAPTNMYNTPNTQPINNNPTYTNFNFTPETPYNFSPNSPNAYLNNSQNSPNTQYSSPSQQNYSPSPNYNTPSPNNNSPSMYLNNPNPQQNYSPNTQQNYNTYNTPSPNNYNSPTTQNTYDNSPVLQDSNNNDNIFHVTQFGSVQASRMFFVNTEENYCSVLEFPTQQQQSSTAIIEELHNSEADPNHGTDPPMWS